MFGIFKRKKQEASSRAFNAEDERIQAAYSQLMEKFGVDWLLPSSMLPASPERIIDVLAKIYASNPPEEIKGACVTAAMNLAFFSADPTDSPVSLSLSTVVKNEPSEDQIERATAVAEAQIKLKPLSDDYLQKLQERVMQLRSGQS